ncbi:MAG TPA: intein-containing Rv2578c family radical SAM protein, partial [Pseudonocardiaceae bacterium]|nr:intein-containing Rv2578c family radical SAM protein [Pseudonocardiaceae bacterium]
YCLAGETPVLMADGRTKPIRDLVVGDRVYGTRLSGRYRRYVPTEVLAHWSTDKPAYRVTLADGTELVTSADHRFLTERGWKHVTGTTTGAHRRPHLTSGNKLMGTGAFSAPPIRDADYRRGYLAGVLRGGAGAGYRDRVARFRLASAPDEVSLRAVGYLAGFGVDVDRAAEVPELLAWPAVPNDSWHKGFLAGVFDARGGRSSRVLRIRNADPEVVRAVLAAFERFRFEYTVEGAESGVGPQVVRLNGGLAEHLRFFHMVDPADSGKRSIDGLAIKSGAELGVVSVRPLDAMLPMFDITTGTGDFIANGVVSHNCFARRSHTYLDLDSGHDFDSQVIVKVNAVEVLTAQLRSPKWGRAHVAMGTNTDPYQRAEGRYRLMPGIVGALAGSGTPLSILTKGTVLSRDIPLLAAAAKDVPVGLGVSIALTDRDIQRRLEPGTPSPQARLELVRRVREAGLPCGVFVAPVLPRLTDSAEQLDRLLAEIAAAGATGVTVLPLHLRPGAREWFAEWLRREHPELVATYRQIYGKGSYADRRYRRLLGERVGPLLRRHGLVSGAARAEPLGGGAGETDPDRAVWPAGSLPPGAPPGVVDQGQLTLL